MEIEINLGGPGFDRFRWRRELGNVAYTEEVGSMMAPLCISRLLPDEVDLILFDDEDGIVLSMPVGCGTQDWKLAETLAKIGGGF
jgi:hypothetical protein